MLKVQEVIVDESNENNYVLSIGVYEKDKLFAIDYIQQKDFSLIERVLIDGKCYENKYKAPKKYHLIISRLKNTLTHYYGLKSNGIMVDTSFWPVEWVINENNIKPIPGSYDIKPVINNV